MRKYKFYYTYSQSKVILRSWNMREIKIEGPWPQYQKVREGGGGRWDFISQHHRSSETKETLRIIQSDSFILEMRNQGSQRSRLYPREPAFCVKARTRSRPLPPSQVPLKRRAGSPRCTVQSVEVTSMPCQLFPWGHSDFQVAFSPHPKHMTCPLTHRFMEAPCTQGPSFGKVGRKNAP